MSRLTPVSPKDLEKKLLKLGFQKLRQKGSHVFYQHPDGRTTTIPFHGNYEIGPVLLGKIQKEIKVSREEFNRL
ncbi:MAG: type II toxin-antitoxin system HicA family toxin [Candidatus Aenigmarchaeota archaeon]|nr:type II toxin-antitoxin system HicA family toxin [Candidatus Aenigmarchaeota archaeon]